MTLPDGQEIPRLEQLHKRRYVSIFGVFELQRTVYGSREGQKIALPPVIPETDVEKRRYEEAQVRREVRLKMRERSTRHQAG